MHMHGHQLTFFTQQDRLHGREPLAQWLLAQARLLGIRGATLNGSLQGLGHDGHLHAVTMFDLGDQPVQVTMIVSASEDARLFAHLRSSGVQVFYMRSAVEFGTLGGEPEAEGAAGPALR
jgi:PII-like signaling protein